MLKEGNKYLITVYNTTLIGEYVPEGAAYFCMKEHFTLDLDAFDGHVELYEVDKCYELDNDGNYKLIYTKDTKI